ncbi:MAG: hypothetical protein QNJ07_16120 [Woeseiaceae bacterium]|nr:hypothetical protein [Woeseiaceae bacterium]
MSRLLVILFLFGAGQAVSADDVPVYESLSGLSIGRIFYSQAERELLDQRRHQPPQSGRLVAGTRAEPRTPAVKHDDAAGFIKSSSGRSRIWKKGRFVPTSQSPEEAVSFPGEVDVERHDAADDK